MGAGTREREKERERKGPGNISFFGGQDIEKVEFGERNQVQVHTSTVEEQVDNQIALKGCLICKLAA